MPRHRKIEVALPEWAEKTPNACLRSVAEDAYYAQALAESYGATSNASCAQLVRAAQKSMRKLEDQRAAIGVRCAEGDRAARKYWEAKVCARK
jgi:hypothetical protein